MYSKGDGVEPDAVEAATWFRKAAEAGYYDAQCNLGTMYSIGAGVEQDWGKATKWYRTAAEAGHAAALPLLLYPLLAEAGVVAGECGLRLLGSSLSSTTTHWVEHMLASPTLTLTFTTTTATISSTTTRNATNSVNVENGEEQGRAPGFGYEIAAPAVIVKGFVVWLVLPTRMMASIC